VPTHAIFILIRLVHVVTGTFWAGGAVLVALSVVPAIRAAGPAGAAVLRNLMVVQKLPYVLIALGIASLVSGVYLTLVVSNGSITRWLGTGSGATYALGALAAVLAALIGLGINIPTAGRLADLQKQTPAVQQQLGPALAHRLAVGTRAGGVLLIIALSAMAVGRYIP